MTYEKAKGYIEGQNNFILPQNLRKNFVEILKWFNRLDWTHLWP